MTQGRSQYIGFSDFTNQSSISYVDYLQAKQFEESIHFGIRQQTKELIASNSQLASANIEVIEGIKDSIDQGFVLLSKNIDSLRDSIDDGFQQLNATFEWGFSEILLSLGRLNDTLQELVRVAKTPAQTWAFEQYDISRDEFRRRLFSEALESVHRAISGYGNNPGYKTEYRFHFLLGTIRLGSFSNCSLEIVDLNQAEAAFLNAARYAQHDYPEDASLAFLGAGRAAYANKKLAEARSHLEAGYKLYDSGEICYQLAKVCAAQDAIEDALLHLEEAVRDDGLYAIKAAGDADFRAFGTQLDQLIRRMRDEAKKLFETGMKRFASLRNDLIAYKYSGPESFQPRLDEFVDLASLDEFTKDVTNSVKENALLDYLSALRTIESGVPRIGSEIFEQFKGHLHASVQTDLNAAMTHRASLVWSDREGIIVRNSLLTGLVTLILGFSRCDFQKSGLTDHNLTAFFTTPVLAVIFGFIAYGIFSSIDSANKRNFDSKAEAAREQVSQLQRRVHLCNSMVCPEGLLAPPELMSRWRGRGCK